MKAEELFSRRAQLALDTVGGWSEDMLRQVKAGKRNICLFEERFSREVSLVLTCNGWSLFTTPPGMSDKDMVWYLKKGRDDE